MVSCIVSFYQELSLVQVSTSFHTCSSLLSNADDNGETDTETETERDRQRDKARERERDRERENKLQQK